MGLCASKKAQDYVKRSGLCVKKVLDSIEPSVTEQEETVGVVLEVKECCACKEALVSNTEVMKQAKESIEKSDALLSDFKAFILQMRHIENL